MKCNSSIKNNKKAVKEVYVPVAACSKGQFSVWKTLLDLLLDHKTIIIFMNYELHFYHIARGMAA